MLEFETASVGSRALAQAIDVAVRAAAVTVAGGLLGVTVGGIMSETVAVVVGTIVGFLLLFGYPAILEARWNGQTVGKRAMGLRVVTTEGAPVSLRHTAVRSILAPVDFFLPPLGVAATVSVLLNTRNQRVGDLFAGTIVLREKTAAGWPVPVSFPPLPGLERYTGSLDIGALTAAQYAVIRSFLVRANDLEPVARARIGIRLANAAATLLHHRPPPTVAPEAFLVSVAAAYQLRLGGPPVPLPPWVVPRGGGPAP